MPPTVNCSFTARAVLMMESPKRPLNSMPAGTFRLTLAASVPAIPSGLIIKKPSPFRTSTTPPSDRPTFAAATRTRF